MKLTDITIEMMDQACLYFMEGGGFPEPCHYDLENSRVFHSLILFFDDVLPKPKNRNEMLSLIQAAVTLGVGIGLNLAESQGKRP